MVCSLFAFHLLVTFEQVQTLIQPIIVGQEALTAGQEAIRNDMASAEVRRIRRELNCWLTNYRTIHESTEFKLAVINYYGMTVSSVGDRIMTARCMVSGAVVQYGELRPAHLVKHSTPQLMVLYGLSSLEIDNARNGILMLDSIEKAFDHLDVCLLYNSLTHALTLKVMNPVLQTKRILPNSTVELRTFADVDGSALKVVTAGSMPYRRILSVHTKFAYSRALSMGWIANTETLSTYFNVSEVGLQEPECICNLTWEQMNYTDIITTI